MESAVQNWPILHCWTGDHVNVTVKDKHDGWRIPSADLSNVKYEDKLGAQQDSWLIPADTSEAWKDEDETVSEHVSLTASPDISSFGDDRRFEEPLPVHETTLSRLQKPSWHDARTQQRGSKHNDSRGPAASAPATMTSAGTSAQHDSVQSHSSSHSHTMYGEKSKSSSTATVLPQHSAVHTYRADPGGSPFKRARVPSASERSTVDSFAKDALQPPTLIAVPVCSRDDTSRGAMRKLACGSATVGPSSSGTEESADATSQPSSVLASLDAHMQMLEMGCQALSKLFVGPAMVTRAWQNVKDEAFLTSVTKAMRRGRQPAADPRLQPDITPRRAARILANRASAARSKEKHRLALANAKAAMKCAEFKVEACTKEMELLTKAIEKLDCENSSLERTVQAMRRELRSMESFEIKLLRQAAERGLSLADV